MKLPCFVSACNAVSLAKSKEVTSDEDPLALKVPPLRYFAIATSPLLEQQTGGLLFFLEQERTGDLNVRVQLAAGRPALLTNVNVAVQLVFYRCVANTLKGPWAKILVPIGSIVGSTGCE